MKKELFLALFLMLPSWASAEGAPIDREAREAEAITYRAKSSATVLEPSTDALRLTGIITNEGKGLWAVHESATEETPHDCGEAEWPDALDYNEER
jgi:hypothetical protein